MIMTDRQQRFLAAAPDSWQLVLTEICNNPKIDHLVQFLQAREQAGAQIYPAKNNIFAALQATPFDQVKVVIVGQDPYHGPGQAHGLSFSVPPNVPLPPSLRNIFKELQADFNISKTELGKSGNLSSWAQQGVLLLNAVLTVEAGQPASHAKQGWELFTDAIIIELLKREQPTVFMLWGAYAQKKLQNLPVNINIKQHLILKAAHPSPLSITGFSGCRHFSQANMFLKQHGLVAINWNTCTNLI